MQKINYIFCLVIFIGLISAFIIFSSKTKPIANIDSKGKNIICFGDSLTSGSNVGREESYPNVLSRLINSPVINAGKDGDTTATALNRLDTDVLNKEPLLVVVILGGNDFLQHKPKYEIFNNLKIIIKAIESKGAMVALGQLGPFSMHTYRKEFKELAEEEGVLLIKDIMTGIFANPELMSDYIHPNRKGYARLAQKVYNATIPILEKNRKIRGEL